MVLLELNWGGKSEWLRLKYTLSRGLQPNCGIKTFLETKYQTRRTEVGGINSAGPRTWYLGKCRSSIWSELRRMDKNMTDIIVWEIFSWKHSGMFHSVRPFQGLEISTIQLEKVILTSWRSALSIRDRYGQIWNPSTHLRWPPILYTASFSQSENPELLSRGTLVCEIPSRVLVTYRKWGGNSEGVGSGIKSLDLRLCPALPSYTPSLKHQTFRSQCLGSVSPGNIKEFVLQLQESNLVRMRAFLAHR